MKDHSINLIHCLNAKYGIKANILTPLSLGADMHASVFKVETYDGYSYFIKLKYGRHSDMNAILLEWMLASGVQEIVPPIKTIDGKLTHTINDVTVTVYPFVDGQNGFCHRLSDDQWIALGKTLRQIHELDLPESIKDQIKKETYAPRWRESVRSLIACMDEGLAEDEVALCLKTFMKKHRKIIHKLVDGAELLSQKISKQTPQLVLCHSDIHGGNVLINKNGSIYIVDWDEPIIAPKERDLMFIGGGVANIWNKPHEEKLFYKGYGKTSIDKSILAYYRYERIVVDIAEYSQALLLTNDGEIKDRLELYKQFMDMFEHNGVVDIAFRTDTAFE